LIVVGAFSWLLLHGYRSHQAATYAARASQASTTQQAVSDYQVAEALDPGNDGYRTQLGRLLMRTGRYSAALNTLKPVTGPAAAIIRSQVYLEEGSDSRAIAAVGNPTTSDERQQLVISYMVAGQTAQARQAGGGVGESQPQVTVALSGGLGLAQELYAQGMYRSTQRVLNTTVDSPGKYLLLAHTLLMQQPSSHQLVVKAQTAAQAGLALDPANLTLHQLLESIDTKLGDTSGAAQQQQLITQLQAGNI
jgi:hypothetical protein